jgi:hypothetical protein
VLRHIHDKAANAKIILLGTTGAGPDQRVGRRHEEQGAERRGHCQGKRDPVTFYSTDPEFEGYRMCDNLSGLND